jgi:hypothetical protein
LLSFFLNGHCVVQNSTRLLPLFNNYFERKCSDLLLAATSFVFGIVFRGTTA